jgi:hypothetical protein
VHQKTNDNDALFRIRVEVNQARKLGDQCSGRCLVSVASKQVAPAPECSSGASGAHRESSHSRHISRRPLMQLPLLQLDLVLIPPQQLLPVRIEVLRVLAPHPPRLILEPCLADLEVGVVLSGRQVLEGYSECWFGRWRR